MKYYTRLKVYKASNLIYDTKTEQAYSYKWYCLAKKFNGLMVVNSYSYSPSTIKHLHKIRKLFYELGIKYIEIEAPRGLQNLETALDYYKSRINNITNQIKKPRTHKLKNIERMQEISLITQKISLIKEFRA